MENLFVCYSKCTTCKKAEKFLKDNNISYEKRDIKEDNPSKEDLKKWLDLSGLDIKKFFNTSGVKYRELGLKDRLKDMTEDEKLDLLATDGMLVKRPIFVGANKVLLGFKEDSWKEIGD